MRTTRMAAVYLSLLELEVVETALREAAEQAHPRSRASALPLLQLARLMKDTRESMEKHVEQEAIPMPRAGGGGPTHQAVD